MDNLARHMRISCVAVSDSDMESRQAAVRNLATSWGKDNKVESIVSTAADIAGSLAGNGVPSPALAEKVQINIQKKSPSFLHDERPLDIGICSGMAMVSLLSGSPSNDGWLIKDVYATALWSAISYQPALPDKRRENLRREVLDTATGWYVTSAEKARERINVPDSTDVKITIDEENVVAHNFAESMNDTIEALRRNAALDREELDFLWWVQLGRSRLLKKQLSKIDEPVRIVTAGIEGAQILRRLPCEVHREIVLRTLDQNPELDLEELLAAIGDDRTVLSTAFITSKVLAHPTVFPLLHALSTGEADQISPSLKRPVSEWGERALLEATFAKMMSQGVGKV
ncbi:GTPase-associated system all-helical protein GASH [Klebsiella aerogenes]|uniref:GTPase-associated system all-helical protein GASH n=1 Tax=Klebsiella aerogenes TaxID=548 RepID=UPI0028DDEF2C|nr:GTPase-associated system all-helical protein GASH [Klebsiella aerogenes]MDT8883250.1 GTPase-associated system all-helical protein GASH [Klebsiella aerogenes]